MRGEIGSVGSLYAHALAIEHEASARYAEFARAMDDLGIEAVADLFRRLAAFEAEHAYLIAKQTYHMALPAVPREAYAWFDTDAPLPRVEAPVGRAMTPGRALRIALAAERRAKAFFEQVVETSTDAAIRDLAARLARDEESHIAWVEAAIQRWSSVPA
jgi:rubrerythrin